MLEKGKRVLDEQIDDSTSPKKAKKSQKPKPNLEKPTKSKKSNDLKATKLEAPIDGTAKKFSKDQDPDKATPFTRKFKGKNIVEEPVNWNDFKKKKKEVREKRKQGKNLYEVINQAKKIGEKLRRKTVEGGVQEKIKLVTELHDLLGGEGNYPKLVMTHDMARIVQHMLKFGSPKIKRDISKELITITIDMLQSKYAKFCVKRMFKYGDPETRSDIINACYGHSVKLASHSVSAPIFDFGFTTFATTLQKQHLVQEFYGDMYKQSKDDSIKHVRDVYEKSPDMKIAALGAMKANLQRILNKLLLDSHLVQTVIMQYLQECTVEDRAEMIQQLAPHIVVLSNSREGSRAAMNCIWNGTNKDRKVFIKALKEHVLELCRHEHGHNSVITMIDSYDDTTLVNKIITKKILSHGAELAADEWGRKVLLWLVAPADPCHFHPSFVNELNEGRAKSAGKKEIEVRRKEIVGFASGPLLTQICEDPKKWLSNSSMAVVTLEILKSGSGKELKDTYDIITTQITNLQWTISEGKTAVFGIEHAGIHMTLKKLLQSDKSADTERPSFGAALVAKLDDEIVKKWLTMNRGCFLLTFIIESTPVDVQSQVKQLLIPHEKYLKNKKGVGANILLKKLI